MFSGRRQLQGALAFLFRRLGLQTEHRRSLGNTSCGVLFVLCDRACDPRRLKKTNYGLIDSAATLVLSPPSCLLLPLGGTRRSEGPRLITLAAFLPEFCFHTLCGQRFHFVCLRSDGYGLGRVSTLH